MKQYLKLVVMIVCLLCTISSFFVARFVVTLKQEMPVSSHRNQLKATLKSEKQVSSHRNQLEATLKHEIPVSSNGNQLKTTLKHEKTVSSYRNRLKAYTAVRLRGVAKNQTSSELIRLFKNALSLNMSIISMCVIKTKHFALPQQNADNSTHAYTLFIPNWQINVGSRPRKLRHFLSAVVRLRLYKEDKARWTMAELKQWIHFQLWAGTEHIYICNHYLKKEEKIMDELEQYEEAGLVTIIDWSHIKLVPGSTNYKNQNFESQLGCYNYVKDKWGNSSTWMYALDMDENPYCPSDQCEGFLTRFLVKHNCRHDDGSDVGLFLLSNYILHGQGDRSRDIHYDRINRITPKPPNGNVKTIFRANWTQKVHMHNTYLRKGQRVNADPSKLRLLHYWGARSQGWGPDTQEMRDSTIEFNDVRETIAIAVRHSLLAYGEFDAFSNATGP